MITKEEYELFKSKLNPNLPYGYEDCHSCVFSKSMQKRACKRRIDNDNINFEAVRTIKEQILRGLSVKEIQNS